MATLAGVLLGAAISLGTTIGTTVFLDYLRHRRESRNLAFAFRGEISALLTIITERGYIRSLEELVRENTTAASPSGFIVHVRREYFSVYVRNVDKIGTLEPPLTEQA